VTFIIIGNLGDYITLYNKTNIFLVLQRKWVILVNTNAMNLNLSLKIFYQGKGNGSFYATKTILQLII